MKEESLLVDLHQNLWSSLKQIFDTDKISIAAAYTINISAFIILEFSSGNSLATTVIISASIIFNMMILLAFKSSKKEVEDILATIDRIYTDQGLTKYFEARKKSFYSKRYQIWMMLTTFLMVTSIAIGLVIRK